MPIQFAQTLRNAAHDNGGEESTPSSRSRWSPDDRLPPPARKLLKSVSETTSKALLGMVTPIVYPRAQGEPVLRPIPGGHAGVPMFFDEYLKAFVRLLPPIGANPEVCVRPRDRSASVWSFRRPPPAGAGGQLVRRLKTDQVILGRPGGMALVMDFDSADAITELFESDDYAALVPIRDKGLEEMNILVTHTM